MRSISLYAKSILLISVVICCQSVSAAPVTTCDALTLYGWGSVPQGNPAVKACQYISEPSPNKGAHWVCGLTANGANPDVHTTFNATTDLHMTVANAVQPPACENDRAKKDLTGTLPGLLGFAPPALQNGLLCGVDVRQRLAALNAVAGNGCKEGFVAAKDALQITEKQATFYIGLCKLHCR